ncbi:MAG: ATP-binding protein [Pseudomonadota bacterium]
MSPGKESPWSGTVAGIAALVALPFLLLAALLVWTTLGHLDRYERMDRVLDSFRSGLAVVEPLETMRDLAPARVYLDAPEVHAHYDLARETVDERLKRFLADVRAFDNPSLNGSTRRLEQSWRDLTIDSDISSTTVPFANIERFNDELHAAMAGLVFMSDVSAGDAVNVNELLLLVMDTLRQTRRELGMVRTIAVYTALRDGYLSSADAEYLDTAWSSLASLAQTLAEQLESIRMRHQGVQVPGPDALHGLQAYISSAEEVLILTPQITLDSRDAWNDGEQAMGELRLAGSALISVASQVLKQDRRHQLYIDAAAGIGLLLLYSAITVLGVLFYRTRYLAVHAQADSRAKSLFLARMSHEIRTPLNGVIGLAELLADTRPTPRQQEYIELIGSAGRSLVSLINDILDHAKIEAGKLDIERVPFDIRAVVAESAQVFGLRAGENRTLIFCGADDDVPTTMIGDPIRIRQVLLNLIGNAVKFTENGRIEVHAELAAANDGSERLRVEVRDTGIGLTPSEQQGLFNLFAQASADVARKFGGTGLGLSISRELIRLMGGSIGVYSGVGAGSVFWFELPLARVETASLRPPEVLPPLPAPVLLVDVDGHLARAVSSLPSDVTRRLSIAVSELDARRILVLHGDLRFLVVNGQRRPQEAMEICRHLSESWPGLVTRLLVAVGTETSARQEGVVGDIAARSVFTSRQLVALLTPPDTAADAAANAPTEPVRSVLPTGLRVLVAEDNPVNQLVTRGLLAKLGIDAEVVENGRLAVERYREQNGEFDIVLMDLDMPVLDGNAATREIRALEADRHWRRCPILALSAHALPEYGAMARAAGMDGQIVKPVTLNVLGEALRNHYRRK